VISRINQRRSLRRCKRSAADVSRNLAYEIGKLVTSNIGLALVNCIQRRLQLGFQTLNLRAAKRRLQGGHCGHHALNRLRRGLDGYREAARRLIPVYISRCVGHSARRANRKN